MRAPDREPFAVVAKAIAAGREPQLTETEWIWLATYIKSKRGGRGGRRKRGHHKSMARHCQGVNRRMLRHCMDLLKIDMRHDPAERKLKRTMRARDETYDLNRRVAERMREQLSDWKPVPTVAALEDILRRSTAADRDEEPYW